MNTVKNILLISFVVVIILLLLYINDTKKKPDEVTYKLPLNSSPNIFGPSYWKSLHDIMSRIPCPSCRVDGEEMMVFLHDLTNIKIGHPIHNIPNFNKWGDIICKVRVGNNRWPAKEEK